MVVAVVATEPILAQLSKVQSFWSRPSHLHALERALQIKNQLKSCTRRTSSAGATPTCPRDPSSGGSGLCEPHFPPIQPFQCLHALGRQNHFSALERCRSNPTQSCHKKDLQYWGDSHLPPGTHPVVAVVSVSHFGPNPQIQSFRSSQGISIALEQTLQIKSTQSCHRRTSVLGRLTPAPGTIPGGGSGLCEPILAPNPQNSII
jgi:hypothetical protein